MTYLQEALANGYRPLGHKPNQTEAKVLIFLDSVKSKAWTVSGLNSLPLDWLATRLDVAPRTLDYALTSLEEHTIIEREHSSLHVNRSGTTRPQSTYRLNEKMLWEAESYVRSVVHAAKRHASDIWSVAQKHPEWTLQQVHDEWRQSLPRAGHAVWCRKCHDPQRCRECRGA